MKIFFSITLAAVLALLLGAPAKAVSVIGDDHADRYVGSGALILPPTSSSSIRQEAAHCPQCRWRFRDPCPMLDHPEECSFTPMPCPTDSAHLLFSLSTDGGSTWHDRGLMCIGPSGPRTVAEVGSAVRDVVTRALPPLVPSHQPSRGVVPRIPVLFHSGQAPVADMVMPILGHSVHITPRPTWTWEFPSGATLVTAQPGSRYPDTTVSHTFRRPGLHRVACRVEWTGVFHVDDLGPFPISESIIQRSHLRIDVAAARAVLVEAPTGPR